MIEGMIPSLKTVWLKAMRDVLYSPQRRMIEDYVELLSYSTGFSFEGVYDLLSDDRICADYEEMKKVFFSSESNVFGHSYANSIINPIQSIHDPVESVCAMLAKNESTRKAVLTFSPYGDEKVPCINSIQFLVRNHRLDVIYYSRGQDMYRKFPCDAMCIASMGEMVAKRCEMEPGTVFANIASAHIYDQDMKNVERYLSEDRKSKQGILTGNEYKYRDYMEILRQNHISVIVSNVELPEIQSVDSAAVAREKARAAYEFFGCPIWVDDMSLSLQAYPLFPGAYTKSMFRQIGVSGLAKLLEGQSKQGIITCTLCRFDGKDYELIEGKNNGYFDFSARIENEKMPLNSVFIGEGFMEHRNKAIQKLIDYTNALLKE